VPNTWNNKHVRVFYQYYEIGTFCELFSFSGPIFSRLDVPHDRKINNRLKLSNHWKFMAWYNYANNLSKNDSNI